MLALAVVGCVLSGCHNLSTSPPAASAALVQTALGTQDRLTQKENVTFQDDFLFQGPVVDIGIARDSQEIIGFGGAFTESTAVVYNQMNLTLQQKFLDLYFTEGGLDYNMGRIPINSCDFSLSNYAFDNVDNDFELENFDKSLTRDTKTIIPLVHEALERRTSRGKNLSFFASPWSPPAWMKNNEQMNKSSAPCLKEGARYKRAWSNYIATWIDAYHEQGIEMWGLTMQNEPENNPRWEACLFTPEESASFLAEYLGPTLKSKFPNLQIFAFDHNKDHMYTWADALHQNPRALKYLTGLAIHWYAGDHFQNVANVRNAFPDLKILNTEATWERIRWFPGSNASTGSWAFGLGYAHDIIGDLNNGALGWVDWNLLLDDSGGPNHVDNQCDAPLVYDRYAEELHIHPQYWFLGHFSKFLPAGSKRILTSVIGSQSYNGALPRAYGTCTEDDGLQATSYERPDGSTAVVVLNCGPDDIAFKLRNSTRAIATSIPGKSIQTYLF